MSNRTGGGSGASRSVMGGPPEEDDLFHYLARAVMELGDDADAVPGDED